LQDGAFERVGGELSRHVDVRVVAATHRDLEAMVAQGAFRQDLWYRLAVFPIRLPPLRERPSDIPALAAHFSLRAAKRLGLPPLVPSARDINLLITYPWPGNVRELAAVIERASILGGGNGLEVAKALGAPAPAAARPPHEHVGENARAPSTALEASPGGVSELGSSRSLDEAMKRHIEGVLLRSKGRVEGRDGAAALLNINPHTLRSRMRKLGISWARFRPQ
jgi:transcriptional regulator with GAF, ATPase, and Fis domain